jgi:mRNA interferase MazF
MMRGDVFLVDLDPRSGSEQHGSRPAVLVSPDSYSRHEPWHSLIVVPITTSPRQARRGPTVVPLATGDGGLERDSMALCHQPTARDRRKFIDLIDALSVDRLAEIDAGVAAALDPSLAS